MTGKKTKKQRDALRELEGLARRLGVRISYGRLRFGGLNLKGGQCIFKGEKWLILDRRQAFEDQLDLFREAIRQCDLTGQEIPAKLTALLGLTEGGNFLSTVAGHK